MFCMLAGVHLIPSSAAIGGADDARARKERWVCGAPTHPGGVAATPLDKQILGQGTDCAQRHNVPSSAATGGADEARERKEGWVCGARLPTPAALRPPLRGGDGCRRDCAQFIRLRLPGNAGLLRFKEGMRGD